MSKIYLELDPAQFYVLYFIQTFRIIPKHTQFLYGQGLIRNTNYEYVDIASQAQYLEQLTDNSPRLSELFCVFSGCEKHEAQWILSERNEYCLAT